MFFIVAAMFSGSLLFAQKSINDQTPEQKLNDEYCTGLFKSTQGTVLDLENSSAPSYINILDWLDGRVAGLKVYKRRNGQKEALIRGQQAGIFVDEILVTSSYLNSLPTSDIAMIKVIREPFFGGINNSGGAIAIYTYAVETPEKDKSK